MSILAITNLAPSRGLTTLADVKQEFGITGGTDDAFLLDLIAQTSTAIEGWCNRAFARETLTETFRLSCSVDALARHRHHQRGRGRNGTRVYRYRIRSEQR